MIVATEVNISTDGTRRICAYRCQDHLGEWHNYGPVISTDPSFDPEAHKVLVAEKMTNALALREFVELLG